MPHSRDHNPQRHLGEAELIVATSRCLKDALALSDEQGIVLAVNAAYERLYGFQESELVGRSFAIIFPGPQRATAESAYLQVFHEAAPPVHRSNTRSANGMDRRVEARIAFVERGHGRVAMLSAIHDIADPAPLGATEDLSTRLDLGELARIYDTHVHAALGMAHALLGDLEQAELVVENTFLAIWRAGLADEQHEFAARSLLLSVLRRSAGAVLLRRLYAPPDSAEGPSTRQPFERWWTRLTR